MDEVPSVSPSVVTTWRRRATQFGREFGNGAGATAAIAAYAVAAAERRRGTSGIGIGSAAGVAAFLAWYWRDGAHRAERLIRSAEDAAVLAAALGARTPLFGRWAAEGDFAGMIARELERAPALVVECGSGASTVVIAHMLRQNGYGRVVSFDHEDAYADRTARLLAEAGLSEVSDVVVAPLRRQSIGGRAVEWYDRSIVEDALRGDVDVLVVDGPPQVTQWARWPALHVFYPRLADDFVALLDDGRTRDTSRAVNAWAVDFPDIDRYWLDTIKGTWLLRRREETALVGPLLRVARTLNPRPSGFGRWPVHR